MKKTLTVFGFLALIYGLAAMMFFSSCSVARREGTTSPCYQKQFKATHVTKRKTY